MQPGCIHLAVPADISQAAHGNGHHALAAEDVESLDGTAAPAPIDFAAAARAEAGWAHVPHAVLKEQHPGLTPRVRVIYMLLVAHNGPRGCFPSITRLADLAGCSADTVHCSLDVLQKLGWLRVQRTTHQKNQYHLLLPATKSFVRVARKVLYDEQLSAGAKYAYALVALFQRYDEQTCKKCIEDLARIAGLAVGAQDHKSTTMEDWLRELRRAGYEDSTARHRRRAAERHLTLLPHERKRAGDNVKAVGAPNFAVDAYSTYRRPRAARPESSGCLDRAGSRSASPAHPR